ncbi:hypothetical protein K503DRAFT_389749 [Rhizopogon vinicolor AM-OR11-026]|uniref:Uncharacterized protein n=1 Tax=Rhizopogon vinicolor AM-OR11-026 TaxID=1314800 RepID=A0A1B7NBJ5_9AGAM|nr:hypothetical protein K503DRAFT_389749 [Rhizopogon vinicolor AM-OR11-026]
MIYAIIYDRTCIWMQNDRQGDEGLTNGFLTSMYIMDVLYSLCLYFFIPSILLHFTTHLVLSHEHTVCRGLVLS